VLGGATRLQKSGNKKYQTPSASKKKKGPSKGKKILFGNAHSNMKRAKNWPSHKKPRQINTAVGKTKGKSGHNNDQNTSLANLQQGIKIERKKSKNQL